MRTQTPVFFCTAPSVPLCSVLCMERPCSGAVLLPVPTARRGFRARAEHRRRQNPQHRAGLWGKPLLQHSLSLAPLPPVLFSCCGSQHHTRLRELTAVFGAGPSADHGAVSCQQEILFSFASYTTREDGVLWVSRAAGHHVPVPIHLGWQCPHPQKLCWNLIVRGSGSFCCCLYLSSTRGAPLLSVWVRAPEGPSSVVPSVPLLLPHTASPSQHLQEDSRS